MIDMRQARFAGSSAAILALLTSTVAAQFRWDPITVPGAPTARWGHSITMVHPGQDLVVFGGTDGSQVFAETWTFGHQTPLASSPMVWSLRATAGPVARHDHATVRADLAGGMLLFGGVDASGALLGDTWLWSGGWTALTPAQSPSPRSGHAMVIDEMTVSTLYLFGGRTARGLDDDLWRFEGGEWNEVTVAASPPAREDHTMSWDPITGDLLLHGGRSGATVFEDEWRFDGTEWHMVRAQGAPQMAGQVAGIAGSVRRRPMFVGGAQGGAALEVVERAHDGSFLAHEILRAPRARTDHAGARLLFHASTGVWNDVMFVFGGRAPNGAALGDVWVVGSSVVAETSTFGSGCGPGPWGPGGPSFHSVGSPILGGHVELEVLAGAPGRAAILVTGPELGTTPLGGCGLLLQPLSRRVALLDHGIPSTPWAQFELEIPFDLALRGTTVPFQVIVPHATGVAYSAGLRLHIEE